MWSLRGLHLLSLEPLLVDYHSLLSSGYCGSQRTCINGNAVGPDRQYMGVYFKGKDQEAVYNECKANWSYKTFLQDCYFKVKESDRVSRKYEGYYQLMKKYLNET